MSELHSTNWTYFGNQTDLGPELHHHIVKIYQYNRNGSSLLLPTLPRQEIVVLNYCGSHLLKYKEHVFNRQWISISEHVLSPLINPQHCPKKWKVTPKLSQNQMSKLKETKKMKDVQLHERTPKQLSNPNPTQKIAH